MDLTVGGFLNVLLRVGNNLPVVWRAHSQFVSCLQIRLVKAGKHALGVSGFKLGVQVGLPVSRVNKAVQSLAGARVLAVRSDAESVFAGGKVAQRHAVGWVVSFLVQGDGTFGDVVTIKNDFPNARCPQVNECVVGFLDGEFHRGDGPEFLVAVGEVQRNVVALDAEDTGPFCGFDPG